MADVVRLRNYRHYTPGSNGWVEYRAANKDEVIVAIVVGHEPKVITKPSDFLDVDDIVLKMAEHIRNSPNTSTLHGPPKRRGKQT